MKTKLLIFIIGAIAGGLLSFALNKPPIEHAPTDIETQTIDELDNAYGAFIQAQQQTLDLFKSEEYFDTTDQSRAEAYRTLLYATLGSIRTGALLDQDQPRFMRAVDWTSKSGMDNPDNNYYFARIWDDKNYVIRGTRGTTTQLIFQIVVGQPGVGNAGPGTNISLLNADDMQLEEDGSFIIHVSPNPPSSGNWLKTGSGAGTIMARATHSDWYKESAGMLDIQEAGIAPIPVLTTSTISKKLREAGTHLYDRNKTWLGYANKTWQYRERNDLSPMTQTNGGLPGQYSSFGSWELRPDQALLISVPNSNAPYQAIQLGNRWFVSLDYETHTSSLNTSQAYLSSDDMYHFVVSHTDPEIQNWLDPVGHEQGLIMLRWQGLTELSGDLAQPAARLINLNEVRDYLPKDVTEFDADKRTLQIQSRKNAARKRFQG